MLRRFSDEEIKRAFAHVQERRPDIYSMMVRREQGDPVMEQDAWTAKVLELAPILKELNLSENLSDTVTLLFKIRVEIRKILGLPI